MEAAAGLDLAALHDVLGRTAARLAGSIQQGDVTPAQCNSCAKHCGNELYTVELRAPFAPNCLNYLSPVSQLLTGPFAKNQKHFARGNIFTTGLCPAIAERVGANRELHMRGPSHGSSQPCNRLSEKNARRECRAFRLVHL